MEDAVPKTLSHPENRPLADIAYDCLLSKIIRLEVPPGGAMVEKSLMDELKLGRTPVREALQRLTVEGLVCHEHFRGVFVCDVTEDSVTRVAEFRKMMDPTIVRHAAERAEAHEVLRLYESLEKMSNAVDKSDFDGYVNSSRAFYRQLAACSRNLHFEESAKRIFNFDARLLYLAAGCDANWTVMANSRLMNALTVADCVKKHTGEEAAASVQLYLVRYFQRLIELLDCYFDSELAVSDAKTKRRSLGNVAARS